MLAVDGALAQRRPPLGVVVVRVVRERRRRCDVVLQRAEVAQHLGHARGAAFVHFKARAEGQSVGRSVLDGTEVASRLRVGAWPMHMGLYRNLKGNHIHPSISDDLEREFSVDQHSSRAHHVAGPLVVCVLYRSRVR